MPDLNNKDEIIQSIFRAAPVGIGMVIDRIITEVNDTLCLMTGYSAEELTGRDARLLYLTDNDYEHISKEKYGRSEKQKSGNIETKWKKKNGEVIDIILNSSAIDQNNISKGITFTALDITRRKKDEDTIRNMSLQINDIAVNIPAGLFQYYLKKNGETGFHYISTGSEQIFGVRHDAPDYMEQFISHIHPDHRERFIESVNYSTGNGLPWEFEGLFTSDSGDSIWFRCSANPVQLEDQVIYNGIGLNITDKIQLLQLTERANKLESLSLLASVIAHDFNNILGGIFGYIEIARNYSRADKVVSGYLDNAMEIFDRTKALTGQLLTFARGGEPVRNRGSISQTLIEVTRYLMKNPAHSYEFSFPDDLMLCDYDSEQICLVFEHIITNAIQAMPAGGHLHVSAENADADEKKSSFLKPGKYVMVTIKDSGTGIEARIIPKIFDPFFTTKPKCTGMGLATSQSIINRHHGCIDVVSTPGKGSAFHVYLPASDKPVEKKSSMTVEHKGKGSILIMDDEVFIRETVGDMLKYMGYDVFKVSEGGEAIKMLQSELNKGTVITAIILDLTIQNGIGGKDTINMIRKLGITLPAFAASGYSDDPVISDPQEYGFTSSIRKPFRMEDLASMLDNYLG